MVSLPANVATIREGPTPPCLEINLFDLLAGDGDQGKAGRYARHPRRHCTAGVAAVRRRAAAVRVLQQHLPTRVTCGATPPRQIVGLDLLVRPGLTLKLGLC